MLILYFKKHKRIILGINLLLSVFFVSEIDASIYDNNISKKRFVLRPGIFAYESGKDGLPGVGGSDFSQNKKTALIPTYSNDIFNGIPEKTTIKDVKKKDRISFYIVQPGDTVSEIADDFHLKQETIIWANNLNSKGFLKLGQKLVILPVDGVQYKIQKGDTLAKIAKKFSVDDIEKIREFNDLKDDGLRVGEKIIIPGAKKIRKKVAKKTILKRRGLRKASVKTKKVVKIISKVSQKQKKGLTSYFIKPVRNGRVTSLYGPRWHSYHRGIDFGAYRGANIVAAASGTVVKVVSGCRVGNPHCGGGYGNHIDILHPNGYKTRYAHLIKTYVKTGQKVVQGQLIAGMGNTGHVVPRPINYKSTAGTHLHFEVLRGNRRINPNFIRYSR